MYFYINNMLNINIYFFATRIEQIPVHIFLQEHYKCTTVILRSRKILELICNAAKNIVLKITIKKSLILSLSCQAELNLRQQRSTQ